MTQPDPDKPLGGIQESIWARRELFRPCALDRSTDPDQIERDRKAWDRQNEKYGITDSSTVTPCGLKVIYKAPSSQGKESPPRHKSFAPIKLTSPVMKILAGKENSLASTNKVSSRAGGLMTSAWASSSIVFKDKPNSRKTTPVLTVTANKTVLRNKPTNISMTVPTRKSLDIDEILVRNEDLPPHMWDAKPFVAVPSVVVPKDIKCKISPIDDILIRDENLPPHMWAAKASLADPSVVSSKDVKSKISDIDDILIRDEKLPPHLWSVKKSVANNVGEASGSLSPPAMVKAPVSIKSNENIGLRAKISKPTIVTPYKLSEDPEEFMRLAQKVLAPKLSAVTSLATVTNHSRKSSKSDLDPRADAFAPVSQKTQAIPSVHTSLSGKRTQYSAEELLDVGNKPGVGNTNTIQRAVELKISAPGAKVAKLARQSLTSKSIERNPVSPVSPPTSAKEDGSGVTVSTCRVVVGSPSVKQPDPRMALADVPHELEDWTGGLGPPPVCWEYDRPAVNGAFKPAYIQVWSGELTEVPPLDTTTPGFVTGESHVSANIMAPPIVHEETIPYIDLSEKWKKKRQQTSETASLARRRQIQKAEKAKKHFLSLYSSGVSPGFQSAFEDVVDPNTPKIELYIRPVQLSDAEGIAEIYNHYTQNSIVPEDQEILEIEIFRNLITTYKKNSLPFIVAIKGPAPKEANTHQHKGPFNTRGRTSVAVKGAKVSTATTTIRKEVILGFSMVEGIVGFLGIGGKGRSRFTGKIHFYSHQNYQKLGVARALLDQILKSTTTSHCDKGGYVFYNPDRDPVYEMLYGGGPRKFHQLIIERTFEARDDPDYEWMKVWLEKKFFFEECGRITSVSRHDLGRAGRFLDVVQFQYEAAHKEDFAGL